MQHITHTSGQANSLVTSDVINQVLQHIDKSVSVHIVWDIPGMAGERPLSFILLPNMTRALGALQLLMLAMLNRHSLFATEHQN